MLLSSHVQALQTPYNYQTEADYYVNPNLERLPSTRRERLNTYEDYTPDTKSRDDLSDGKLKIINPGRKLKVIELVQSQPPQGHSYNENYMMNDPDDTPEFTSKGLKFKTPHANGNVRASFAKNAYSGASPPRIYTHERECLPAIFTSPSYKNYRKMDLPLLPQTAKAQIRPDLFFHKNNSNPGDSHIIQKEDILQKLVIQKAKSSNENFRPARLMNENKQEVLPSSDYTTYQPQNTENVSAFNALSGSQYSHKRVSSRDFAHPVLSAINSNNHNVMEGQQPEFLSSLKQVSIGEFKGLEKVPSSHILVLDDGLSGAANINRGQENVFMSGSHIHKNIKSNLDALKSLGVSHMQQRVLSDVNYSKEKSTGSGNRMYGFGMEQGRVKSSGVLEQKSKFPKELFNVGVKKKLI